MYLQANTRTSNGWRPHSLQLGYLPRSRGRIHPRRRFRLGDDPQILAQVFSGQSGAPAADNVRQAVQQAIDQGSLWTTENCSGAISGSKSAVLTSSIGGMAIKFAGATGPLAPVMLIAGGVLQVFGAIFGHHAAKVQQEQQIICAVVQAVNDSLSVIDQAFQSGQISASQAAASLEQLYSDLRQNVQPILKQDSSHCNAACFILAEARGVIARRKQLYQMAGMPAGSWQLTCRDPQINATGDRLVATCEDMQGGWGSTTLPSIAACAPGSITNVNGALQCQPAPAAVSPSGQPVSTTTGSVQNLVSQATSSTGLPSWAIYAGAALLALKLLK
jgi:hypothetical protein